MMLEILHIKNLALIENMTLEFSAGINVLTGETGAGKSFIIKALNFVLGEKLSTDIIRKGAEKAQVEAGFFYNNKEIILRREINEKGRSRLYINDSLSSLDSLKELKNNLISHTSQHAQQNLLNPTFQADLLNQCLDNNPLLQEREYLIQSFRNVDNKLKVLLEKRKELKEKRELLEIQKEEIARVNPKEGEEEELELIRSQAKEVDSAKQLYNKMTTLLYGDVSPGFFQQLNELEKIVSQVPLDDQEREENTLAFQNCRDLAANLYSRLKESGFVNKRIDLDRIEARLFAISQLKRKLRRTFPEILELKNEISESLSFLDECNLDISQMEKEKGKIAESLTTLLKRLQPIRQDAANKFTASLENELKELGFSRDVKVIPEFQEFEMLPGIKDYKGRLLWSPNPGQIPQPLDKIASGGELSRFLLALITLQNSNKDLTYIFDEVDTGVGGLTLNRVGEKLEALAKDRQIILITHWPQLASRANRHFVITKSVRNANTYTECETLTGKRIKAELERMAGGKESRALNGKAAS